MTLALGGTTKCRNNSLVPPPDTEYEPTLNSTHLPQSDGDHAWWLWWVWYEQLAPAGLITDNCPMGFRPGLHAGQAKRYPGLLQTRTRITFSYTLPVFAQ